MIAEKNEKTFFFFTLIVSNKGSLMFGPAIDFLKMTVTDNPQIFLSAKIL